MLKKKIGQNCYDDADFVKIGQHKNCYKDRTNNDANFSKMKSEERTEQKIGISYIFVVNVIFE